MNYIPSIVAAVVALLGVFEPYTQSYITNHPSVAAVIAAIAAVIAHLLPSPVAK